MVITWEIEGTISRSNNSLGCEGIFFIIINTTWLMEQLVTRVASEYKKDLKLKDMSSCVTSFSLSTKSHFYVFTHSVWMHNSQLVISSQVSPD